MGLFLYERAGAVYGVNGVIVRGRLGKERTLHLHVMCGFIADGRTDVNLHFQNGDPPSLTPGHCGLNSM